MLTRSDGSLLYKGSLWTGEAHGEGAQYNPDGTVDHSGRWDMGKRLGAEEEVKAEE